MKKQFAYFILALVLVFQASSFSLAKNSATSPVKIAIKKYKTGNYTGCLQDCQYIVKNDPSNALAYYYMAMSYVQAGRKIEAIDSYTKVLNLSLNSNLNSKLAEYAATGKRCLETPDKCVLEPETGSTIPPEIDKLIVAPFTDGLSNAVRKDFEQKRLDSIKNQINSDKELDDYQFKKLNDASGQTPSTIVNKKSSDKPTNDEIVAALKVLNEAGLNPYTQVQKEESVVNPYEQMVNYHPSNDNNTMLNMLPFILAQNKNGTSNYSPELMQSVMMNSMIPDFNFDLDKDSK